MPKYTLKASDGASYTLDSPNELTQDQLNTAFSEVLQQVQPTQQQQQQPVQPAQNPYTNYQNLPTPNLTQNPYALAEAQSQKSGETTAGGLVAAAGRGAAPYAAAATLGAATAGPLGAAAAPTALFAADMITPLVNSVLGTNYSSPSESIQNLLTLAGTPNADTEAERIVQAISSGATSTSAFTGLGKTLLGSANPLAQRVGQVLMESPLAQYFGGGLGSGAAQAVAEAGGGPVPQVLASLLGGVGGARAAGSMSRAGTPAMSVVPETRMNFGDIKFTDFKNMASSNNPADARAANLVIKSVKDATGDQYQNVLKSWEQSGKPLIEVFQQPVTKLGERAASFPKGESVARDYFAKQTSQTQEFARQSISKNVGEVDNFEKMIKTAVEEGQKQAKPLYEKAYKTTGGTAAFIRPLEKQLNQEGNAIAKLQKELSGLKNEETLVLGKEASQKYNVYGQSNINQKKQFLSQKMQDLTEKLNKAISKKQQTSDFLNESRADLAAGKQVVWSPNLQRFLDNAEVQKNLKTAFNIEKNNADSEFRAFTPQDYGIVGFDTAGDPILKKVPNLKMLDMIKKGLDARISSLKNPITGRYTEEGQSVINLKKSLINEIDNILGKSHPYVKARETAGDYLSIEQRMLEGKDFFKTSTGKMKLNLEKMTIREREAYKKGVASAANTKIEKLIAEGQNPYPRIMGTSGDKMRWRQVLTKEEYTNLEQNLKSQDLLYNTKKQIMGNAAKRAQENQDFGGGLGELMTGSGPRSLIIRNIANFLKNRTTNFNDDMAQSVAQILFEENPKQKAIIMKKVFQQNKNFTDRQLENMKNVFLSAEKSLKKIPVSVQIQAIQGPAFQQQQQEGEQ
jgi:hypothetical protein